MYFSGSAGAHKAPPSTSELSRLSASQACNRHSKQARTKHATQAGAVDKVTGFVGLQDSQRLSLERHVIQWYPGHIAKAERQLKQQLSKVDIVFDVRDARVLHSTAHPQIKQWTSHKRRFVLVNRMDMVSKDDLQRWRQHYAAEGEQVFFTDGQSGNGTQSVVRAADAMSEQINATRLRRGLKPRSVRACVVGYPNIGKSALINRLLKRKVVVSEARPGVTKSLRWVRMGSGLDLLDAPGIIPGNMRDQMAAAKLAICDDIGQASYVNSAVATMFVSVVQRLPEAEQICEHISKRYGMQLQGALPEDFVWGLADKMFQGDAEVAAARILQDYRKLRFGAFALEQP